MYYIKYILVTMEIYIYIYKLLAYRYLNTLNQFGRYCASQLKVAKSPSHISTILYTKGKAIPLQARRLRFPDFKTVGT